MKAKNIKYSVVALMDNQIKAHRFFCSDEAKNKWCNKQYNVFGEEVTVEVYDFNDHRDPLDQKPIEVWHA